MSMYAKIVAVNMSVIPKRVVRIPLVRTFFFFALMAADCSLK